MHATVHFPILLNALGHVAGAAAFAVLLALLLRGARREPETPIGAPLAAAGLALFWNAGSLAVLLSPAGGAVADGLASLSFAVLSLLPAVLLHLALGRERVWLRATGYSLSVAAATMHLAEGLSLPWGSHAFGVNLITFGFGVLAVAAAALLARRTGMRAVAAISLFLLAASFLHFGSNHGPASWSHELFLHHAGIPLALFVLLQDHRFLLLDVLVRLLGAALPAAVLAAGFVAAGDLLGLWQPSGPAALPLVAFLTLATAGILFYPWLRDRLHRWVQGVLFGRRDLEAAIAALRELRPTDAEIFFEQAGGILADFVRAKRYALLDEQTAPTRSQALGRHGVETPRWAETAVPLRSGSGRPRTLLLGARAGGRRYLSQDFADLDRLALEAADQFERLRREEQRRLLAEAELEALRAQINPHFLFNALHTLYGLIPRSADDARRALVHLADIFRYSLHGREPFVTLECELEIVEAYLEIERLRLGSRLDVRIEVEAEARRAKIPALSVQPLVENAVKHGISAKPEGGAVRVAGLVQAAALVLEVEDDGVGFDADTSLRQGHGLGNVRRRLELSYGDAATLELVSSPAGTSVKAVLPLGPDAPRPARSALRLVR